MRQSVCKVVRDFYAAVLVKRSLSAESPTERVADRYRLHRHVLCHDNRKRREVVHRESILLTGCKMMLRFAAPTAQASMERERKERARKRETEGGREREHKR